MLFGTHPVKRIATVGLIVVFSFGIVLGIRNLALFERPELFVYDQLVGTSTSESEYSSNILLLEIRESDIQALARWPLTDRLLADLLKRILSLGPRVIGVDIYRDFSVPPGSKELNDILDANKNIIFIEKFGSPQGKGIAPPKILEDTEQYGFSDIVVDDNGVVRRNLLLQGDEKRIAYSFALRMALLYLQSEGILPRPSLETPEYMQLGEVTLVPLDPQFGAYRSADTAGYQIMMDYSADTRPFPTASLEDLYSDRITQDQLSDKIVIVGVSSESVKDAFVIPHFFQKGGKGVVSGSTVHAHAVHQLLNIALGDKQPITTWPEWSELVWIFLWTLLGGFAGVFANSATRFFSISTLGVAFLALISKSAFALDVWIPVVPPAASWLLAMGLVGAYFTSIHKKERKDLMLLLSKQVSPEVAEEIWSRRDEVLEGGRIKPRVMTATVMFTDLQGFTTISDKLPPKQFMDWLNSYMNAMSELIMRFGGVIDDYAGDGIKANFGIPFRRADEAEYAADAKNAVDCALAMSDKLAGLNRRWSDQDLPNVGIRIGIHSGTVLVGTLGSAERMKFTSVGRNVNLASRLESNKELRNNGTMDASDGCSILVSEETARYLSTDYHISLAGEIRLRGLSGITQVFQVKNRSQADLNLSQSPSRV